MTTEEMTADVCVVGSGPAGALAAVRSAGSGASVLVVSSTSRAFRGLELLSGRAAPRLRELGVLAGVEAVGTRCAGTVSRWATDDFIARPALLDPWGGGWIVDRHQLDPILADAATARGARAITGRAVAVDPTSGCCVVWLADGRRIRAGTAVVATGRASSLLRHATSTNVDHRLVVLTAELPSGIISGLGHQLLIDRAAAGWWYALASQTTTTVAFCTDGDLVRSRGIAGTWTQACENAAWLPAAGRSCPVRVRSQLVSTVANVQVGAAYVIGDAALAVDPLSGQGIAIAIEGACRWSAPEYTEWHASITLDHRGARKGHVRRSSRAARGRVLATPAILNHKATSLGTPAVQAADPRSARKI